MAENSLSKLDFLDAFISTRIGAPTLYSEGFLLTTDLEIWGTPILGASQFSGHLPR